MTSLPIPGPTGDDDDLLAAEYVLGVLSGPDWRAAQTRVSVDATFAMRVADWEQRLSGLNDGFPEAAVPDTLLPRLEARLFPLRRRGWRGPIVVLGGMAAAAAIALAVFLVQPPGGDPALVARLETQDAALVYSAAFADDQLTVTRLAGTPAPAGQVHELWIIAPGAAPVSLGLLQDAPLSIRYPRPPAGWVLAVSVEPAGGAPGGAPTGPVILTAEIGI